MNRSLSVMGVVSECQSICGRGWSRNLWMRVDGSMNLKTNLWVRVVRVSAGKSVQSN